MKRNINNGNNSIVGEKNDEIFFSRLISFTK